MEDRKTHFNKYILWPLLSEEGRQESGADKQRVTIRESNLQLPQDDDSPCSWTSSQLTEQNKNASWSFDHTWQDMDFYLGHYFSCDWRFTKTQVQARRHPEKRLLPFQIPVLNLTESLFTFILNLRNNNKLVLRNLE